MKPHVAQENIEIGRSLLRALANTGISVLYQDLSMQVVWAQNAPGAWADGQVVGLTDRDFLGDVEARRVIAAKEAVSRSGKPQSLEIAVAVNGNLNWYEMWIDADRAEDGRTIGIITTAVDISEQKQREQTLRTLLREVSHRSKNLLAIIQSIATQTGRYSASIDGFLVSFRGRIQSLAASQDLVTSSNWRGADLRELVEGQVGRYAGDPGQAVRIEGENPYLNPNAALHIGLALHELAVNSVSFGALGRPDGVVTISADVLRKDGSEPELLLTWREEIDAGHAVSEKRFGTTALERVVPASLNGQAELTIEQRQLTYRLVVPKNSFDLE